MNEEDYTEEPKPAKKSFGWLGWFLVAVTVWSLVGLTQPPVVIRSHKNANLTQAISNLKQIGLSLLEFENEFGEYPNEKTAPLVTKRYSQHRYNLSGKSSNAFFRQIFAAGITGSEAIFYAKIPRIREPDDDTKRGKCLEKGEVAFAYISGLSTEGNPARIVAFAPVIPGTTRFNPKPFKGMAVFLRMDNAVISMKIGEDGHVRQGGIDILSPENPVWNGELIDIRYPE